MWAKGCVWLRPLWKAPCWILIIYLITLRTLKSCNLVVVSCCESFFCAWMSNRSLPAQSCLYPAVLWSLWSTAACSACLACGELSCSRDLAHHNRLSRLLKSQGSVGWGVCTACGVGVFWHVGSCLTLLNARCTSKLRLLATEHCGVLGPLVSYWLHCLWSNIALVEKCKKSKRKCSWGWTYISNSS